MAGPPWEGHRRRAEVLRERHPFAAELMAVYLALLDVWEEGWTLAHEDRPPPPELAAWAAERVLPRVVKVTEATGPEPLVYAVRELYATAGLEGALAGWLAGDELAPVQRYLARASLHAPLVALGADVGEACVADPAPRDERHCPRCGGLPQLSFRPDAQDRLVSGHRHLACARCGHSWRYSGGACPCCGETSGGRRTVYAERRAGPVVGRADHEATGDEASGDEATGDEASGDEATGDEPPTFPHLRVDACTACGRYLIDVDAGRDPGAVPEVDELAAVPLDLYATEHGISKITPNLLGF